MGLGVPLQQNNLDIILTTSWMFLGLSLFCQGIGNISSFLNTANHYEIEAENTQTYFSELCSSHDLDAKTASMIYDDVERQYEKYGDNEFTSKSKILSSNLLFQLETSIYKTFIESFSLFKSISIDAIRILKSNCHYGSNTLLMRKDNLVSTI